jgi:hypothetical protein
MIKSMKSAGSRVTRLFVCATVVLAMLLNATGVTALALEPSGALDRVAQIRGLSPGELASVRDGFVGVRPRVSAELAALEKGLSGALLTVARPLTRAVVSFFLRMVMWPKLERDMDRLKETLANALEEEGVRGVVSRLEPIDEPTVARFVLRLRESRGDRASARVVARFVEETLSRAKSHLLGQVDALADGGMTTVTKLVGGITTGGDSALVALLAMPINPGRAAVSGGKRSAVDWFMSGDNLKKALVALMVVSGVALAIFLIAFIIILKKG